MWKDPCVLFILEIKVATPVSLSEVKTVSNAPGITKSDLNLNFYSLQDIMQAYISDRSFTLTKTNTTICTKNIPMEKAQMDVNGTDSSGSWLGSVYILKRTRKWYRFWYGFRRETNLMFRLSSDKRKKNNCLMQMNLKEWVLICPSNLSVNVKCKTALIILSCAGK